MNPKEKRKEDKDYSEHSEDLSLESLSAAVEDFTPRDAGRLSLSEAMAKEAEDAFTNLQGLKEPWVSGHGCKDGIWLQHVFEGMQDDRRYVFEGMQEDTKIGCLGLLFASLLKYIREGQRSLNDMSGLERIEKTVNQWKPSGRSGPLEQQFLLKELRIGRRVEKLLSWTGVVSGNMKDPYMVLFLIYLHTHIHKTCGIKVFR